MLRYIGVIERENTITIDGYSDKKYMKSAIKEIGGWVLENIDESEGRILREYGKESLQKNLSGESYCFEIEEVPCACNWDEEKEEMEYEEGSWYFLIRIIK